MSIERRIAKAEKAVGIEGQPVTIPAIIICLDWGTDGTLPHFPEPVSEWVTVVRERDIAVQNRLPHISVANPFAEYEARHGLEPGPLAEAAGAYPAGGPGAGPNTVRSGNLSRSGWPSWLRRRPSRFDDLANRMLLRSQIVTHSADAWFSPEMARLCIQDVCTPARCRDLVSAHWGFLGATGPGQQHERRSCKEAQ
jgi:hypothetical protein